MTLLFWSIDNVRDGMAVVKKIKRAHFKVGDHLLDDGVYVVAIHTADPQGSMAEIKKLKGVPEFGYITR